MSKDWLIMNGGAWSWFAAAACLLLALGILWLELRKKHPYAWLRVLLSWLAVGALLLLAWEPAYRQDMPQGQALLLTANAPQAPLDSLKNLYPSMPVFSLEEGNEKGIYLPHSSYLQQELAEGSVLYVLGEGPPAAAASYLRPYQIKFFPAQPIPGLHSLHFPASLTVGDTLRIAGKWQQPADSLSVKLALANAPLDSGWISPGATGFQLQDVPKVAGNLLYKVWIENPNKDTIEAVDFLVRTEKPAPLRLALFTGYASYESSYLKNWLAEKGHSIYFQVEMAPNRYKREWINLPDKSYSELNKKLLEEVDVLLMDQSYFQALSALHHQLIARAVENGLGMLVLSDGSPLKMEAKAWQQVPPLRMSGRLEEVSPALSAEAGIVSLSLYKADAPEWYEMSFSVQRPLLLYRPYGTGILGLSLLVETYPLLLKDREEAYAFLWTRFLNQLSRPSDPSGLLKAAFPGFAGKQQQLELFRIGKEVPELLLTEPNGREQLLPLIQDDRIPERWHAFHWPRKEGLYRLQWPDKDTLHFQVLNAAALPALQQATRMEGFQAFLKEQAAPKKEIDQQQVRQRIMAVPPLWFYLLFLLSMTGLWLERKLNARLG